MSDFLFGAVWSRTFGPVLLVQVAMAITGVVFCWRAALAFNRPAPWWWFGFFFLLLAGRPGFLLSQDVLFPRSAWWVAPLDVLVMPSAQVLVLGMAVWTVWSELTWHREQLKTKSENLVQLKQIVDPQSAPPLGPRTDSQDLVERYVDQLQGLVTLWANAAGVGIISIGEDSVIKYANPGAHFLFGYKWGALLGRPLTDLMQADLRPRHLAAVAHYLASGQRTFAWRDLHFDALCADGTTRPITLTFIEHRLLDERTFTGVMQERRVA